MIRGVHTMFYSSEPEALRAFLRDKLGFPFTDVGDRAHVNLDALPGQVFEGTVTRFAETEDDQSRTMRTEIDLESGAATVVDTGQGG